MLRECTTVFCGIVSFFVVEWRGEQNVNILKNPRSVRSDEIEHDDCANFCQYGWVLTEFVLCGLLLDVRHGKATARCSEPICRVDFSVGVCYILMDFHRIE